MSSVTFTARNIPEAGEAASQCAIVPLFKGKALSGVAKQLDRGTGGAIRRALALEDFSGRKGETLLLHGAGKIKRLLLVGCGKEDAFDRETAMKVCEAIAKKLDAGKATEATLHLAPLRMKKKDYPWVLAYLARLLVTSSYRYTETLSEPRPDMKLARLVVNTEGAIGPGEARTALSLGKGVGTGVNEARNLANLPGNICTPAYLARQARKLARGEAKFSVNVLEEKRMRELGMGALLSVSAGSAQPAKLIVVQYKGARRASEQPYVLVGKGITFDSGGISLKPGAKMDEMKFDMGGAASVMGTLRALKELQLPINVVGIIAAAENMPSGTATKPGDVVTSMSGKTIEILNTDAEGRLVLCDALTYAAKFKPRAVIDIATLTGACVVALGSHASAVYSKNDELAGQLLDAGIESHDRAWRMPLWDDYQKQLKSNFADMANIGGPGGGSITAACFLSRFTEDYDWAHFDIAGSAWDSAPKGATGRPVALLTQYLVDRAGD